MPNNNNNQYVNQIKQQIQQAEANKYQASGSNANNGYENNTN